MSRRRARYRTGLDAVDAHITELIDRAGVVHERDLVFEMVVSAIRLGREVTDRGDLKLANAALKELRYSFLVFEPYADNPKVSIFGSARLSADDPACAVAREFGRLIAAENWMVITGAGPGIMEAGVEGAGAERAFGVNIVLPFETDPTPLLLGDPKLINYHYFFTRKIAFVKESAAFVLLPGGFGTMDELFELVTLMQTGRTVTAPIVLLEPPGGTYWPSLLEFLESEHVRRGLISADDLCLVRRCADPAAAVDEITGFYSTYHSQRYVGRRLVLRLNRELDDDAVDRLNDEFADLVVRGRIERVSASAPEIDDGDHVDLPRLAFTFKRAEFARLRRLIDAINAEGYRMAG